MRLSTGLLDILAVNYGLGAMMNGGVIRVYGSAYPASADDPPGAPTLGQITTEGRTFIPGDDQQQAGLLLAHVSPGALVGVGNWRLKGAAEGQAIWWRWYWAGADDQEYSILLPRADGIVGTELVLETTAITPSTNILIEQFRAVLPRGI